jgi:hypothetical protein
MGQEGKGMTDREKLIEILRKPIFPHELADPTEAVADYLLDNGVTVQRWIPVTERLQEGKALTCDHRGNIHVMFHYSGFQDPFGISRNDSRYYPVTHWMPMPEPPK